MGIGGAAVTALLGYSVVFFGLVLLMGVIALFGKLMAGKKASAPAAAPAPAAPAAAPVAEKKPDIGVRDGVRVCDLNGVDDKTAAMIMAIVADKTGIPLNELRFISIKEL
ncbi:MAG: OadG family protein [Clostridia bacterium]|nr:OadG family protein [Clostridia bacterium]